MRQLPRRKFLSKPLKRVKANQINNGNPDDENEKNWIFVAKLKDR